MKTGEKLKVLPTNVSRAIFHRGNLDKMNGPENMNVTIAKSSQSVAMQWR